MRYLTVGLEAMWYHVLNHRHASKRRVSAASPPKAAEHMRCTHCAVASWQLVAL